MKNVVKIDMLTISLNNLYNYFNDTKNLFLIYIYTERKKKLLAATI